MLCKKCGSEIPEGAKNCKECGNPVMPEKSVNAKPDQKKRIASGIAVAVVLVAAILVIVLAPGNLGNKKSMTTGNTAPTNQSVPDGAVQPDDNADPGKVGAEKKNKTSNKKDSADPADPKNSDASPTDDSDSPEEVIENYTDEYIFPYSDSKYLKKSDVKDLPLDTISLAKDELYARHGRMFNIIDTQRHFEECGWYTAIYTEAEWNEYGDSYFFNKYEKKNRDFLENWEKKMSKKSGKK